MPGVKVVKSILLLTPFDQQPFDQVQERKMGVFSIQFLTVSGLGISTWSVTMKCPPSLSNLSFSYRERPWRFSPPPCSKKRAYSDADRCRNKSITRISFFFLLLWLAFWRKAVDDSFCINHSKEDHPSSFKNDRLGQASLSWDSSREWRRWRAALVKQDTVLFKAMSLFDIHAFTET